MLYFRNGMMHFTFHNRRGILQKGMLRPRTTQPRGFCSRDAQTDKADGRSTQDEKLNTSQQLLAGQTPHTFDTNAE